MLPITGALIGAYGHFMRRLWWIIRRKAQSNRPERGAGCACLTNRNRPIPVSGPTLIPALPEALRRPIEA